MEPTAEAIGALADWLRTGQVLVLSGAGLSTDSGIPDYRGPTAVRRTRGPMTYKELLSGPTAQRRYWARSFLGWPKMRAAQPNRGHLALARLEELGLVRSVITQNVDRLHTKAGTRDLVELHGALHEVRCLGCQAQTPRDRVQERLAELNPAFFRDHLEVHPDGDAELGAEETADFVLADCEACGGVLKPNVVFFGENVPADVTKAAFERLDSARALFVVGSSLTVFSGYRFVRRAKEQQKPVAILNLGPTRGDAEATLRLDALQAPTLDGVLAHLGP
ncbi:MAG: NAD-dependent protein deacetylase [Myxococcota bacterium]